MLDPEPRPGGALIVGAGSGAGAAVAAALWLALGCAERPTEAGTGAGPQVVAPAEAPVNSREARATRESSRHASHVAPGMAGPRSVRFIRLPLEGYGPPTVAVPSGPPNIRPTVVALHGHSIRPEEACRQWSRATHGFPFVLCPQGLPADAGNDAPVTWGTPQQTAREIAAGLRALWDRFGGRLARATPILGGFSLGAERTVAVAPEPSLRFQRLVLGEGGYAELTSARTQHLALQGTERVLLVCSTRACEMSYGPVQARLRAAGIAARIVSSGGTEHRFRGPVVEQTRLAWHWIVDGAPGYAEFRTERGTDAN